jgi:sugar transferase (PEP-CTERM/EpsH1 system associated)
VKEILYLTHRIPYPPDKGDKIRSYHLLRKMAERWTVHLGTFIDDQNDWQYVPKLEEICCETKFVRLNPTVAKLRALRGLVAGTSLTMPYYGHAGLRKWVTDLVSKREVDCAIAFSSSMAQYVMPPLGKDIRTVVDFCDMDSDKWRQYSEMFGGVKRWIFGREGKMLRQEETDFADKCAAAVFISEEEAKLFCRLTGIPAAKVYTVQNGVDTAYFDPELIFSDPFSGDRNAIVFLGAMDYWPNIDAVCWFVEKIFPAVKKRNPEAVFFIVGSKPSPTVTALNRFPGVTVTGRVEDVRPYLRFARCVVTPLRLARGVQNKVLEAMAMARPIVATTEALEGISYGHDSGISVCDSEASWIEKVLQILREQEVDGCNPGGRRIVTEKHSWDASAEQVAGVVSGASGL